MRQKGSRVKKMNDAQMRSYHRVWSIFVCILLELVCKVTKLFYTFAD